MIFPDIPRIYTALAETFAVIIVSLPILKKQSSLHSFIIKGAIILIGQVFLQFIADKFPLYLWILGMFLNITWMYLSLYLLKNSIKISFYLTAKSFVAAELTAALSWHLYCLLAYKVRKFSLTSEIIFMGISYALCFISLALVERNADSNDTEKMIGKKEVLIAAFTALSIFLFSNIGFLLTEASLGFNDSSNIFILRSMMNFSGLLILLTQEAFRRDEYLRQELLAMQNAFQLQYNQYQAYRENSDIISRKVHDLKHQIGIIKDEANDEKRASYLHDMEISIREFESKVDTGNPVLDTIISQKSRYCLQHDITFTCLVQGELLNHLDVMDLSSLFGNAIDNAIEAVEKIPNKDQRLITLKISKYAQFAIIKLDNYDLSELHFTTESLPQTSKSDKQNHGIGLKSIRYICEKYQGHMTLTKKDNWVKLKIILPSLGQKDF
ncbi:ATP-binding protein [Streptococcus sp. S784/96/1]|uniref:ATP-binding protein n=1 Tax=Streptococcus sp. S784/96/1 TaxID=2653499 RepID=UPI00138A6842|nr:ATP-binding protein [Streptococcus sp. S784/96/1]